MLTIVTVLTLLTLLIAGFAWGEVLGYFVGLLMGLILGGTIYEFYGSVKREAVDSREKKT